MKWYRLRKGNRVMGYARESEDGILYKAYNDFHWHSERLEFDQVDISVGIKDKRHRVIFEGDVVLYLLRESQGWRRGIIKFNNTNAAVIVDEEYEVATPIQLSDYRLFEHEKLEVVSHVFSHGFESQIDF
ncbi:YopX family protein [Vaginella massiliensis]|uniref:YopX family protein n=1 Tax=Vaginella massiliensis TaxID=1816680 RepID=UPI003751340C